MSYARDYQMEGGPNYLSNLYSLAQNSMINHYRNRPGTFSMEQRTLYIFPSEVSGNVDRSCFEHMRTDSAPSMKRRKHSLSSWESYGSVLSSRDSFPAQFNPPASTSASCKRDRSQREDDELIFLSRDEIERLSPSRRDGIDALRETHLRYSYCAFLQDLGQPLELPQTTIGTAIVLCHRFFVRRSHAFHDRFLIATAALFLATKSEETARPLNTVLRLSCEIYHKKDVSFVSYFLPADWFEQYRERVTEAEQLILTTLNFELGVQHPFATLMSVFNKSGLSQSMLLSVALNLISEGLRCSLWLQFKPHQIAAGAAYLAAKFLNMDLASHRNLWQDFHATPSILHDVAYQLLEVL